MTFGEYQRARTFVEENRVHGNATTAVVVAIAFERGIDVSVDERRRAVLEHEGRRHNFGGRVTSLNHRLARRATDQKEVASRLMRHRGVAAPESTVFAGSDADRAWRWAKPILPVVVKPHASDQGRGVHVDLRNRRAFLKAFAAVADGFGEVMVEKFTPGTEHRVLVVNGEVVAATRRVPANVVGDGRTDVAGLVERKNLERVELDDLVHKPIDLDATALAFLKRQRLGLDSVLAEGQRASFRATSNLHTGGDAVDATDDLRPDEIDLARRAVATFGGLRLAGLDLLLPRSPGEETASVLEINAWPMLSMHHFPAEGRPRNVAAKVVDAMFPGTAPA